MAAFNTLLGRQLSAKLLDLGSHVTMIVKDQEKEAPRYQKYSADAYGIFGRELINDTSVKIALLYVKTVAIKAAEPSNYNSSFPNLIIDVPAWGYPEVPETPDFSYDLLRTTLGKHLVSYQVLDGFKSAFNDQRNKENGNKFSGILSLLPISSKESWVTNFYNTSLLTIKDVLEDDGSESWRESGFRITSEPFPLADDFTEYSDETIERLVSAIKDELTLLASQNK